MNSSIIIIEMTMAATTTTTMMLRIMIIIMIIVMIIVTTSISTMIIIIVVVVVIIIITVAWGPWGSLCCLASHMIVWCRRCYVGRSDTHIRFLSFVDFYKKKRRAHRAKAAARRPNGGLNSMEIGGRCGTDVVNHECNSAIVGTKVGIKICKKSASATSRLILGTPL